MPEQTYQYYLNQKTVAAHYLELGNVSKALIIPVTYALI